MEIFINRPFSFAFLWDAVTIPCFSFWCRHLGHIVSKFLTEQKSAVSGLQMGLLISTNKILHKSRKKSHNNIGKSARIIADMKIGKSLSSAISEAKQKKDDLTRSRSLNRLGLPEARENTLSYLTSVL